MFDLFRFNEKGQGQFAIKSEIGSLGIVELVWGECVVERGHRRKSINRFTCYLSYPVSHSDSPVFKYEIL